VGGAGVGHDRPPVDPERQVGEADHQVPPLLELPLAGEVDDLDARAGLVEARLGDRGD
jgi:hypothetical protein